jgi:pimeloyl-ACP methyl ester carboxylesterase
MNGHPVTRAQADPGYVVDGPIGQPVIMFLHGTRLSKAAWTAQLVGLGGGHRVIAMDLPGHGASPTRRFTMEAAREAVLAVIDEVAGGPVVLVGLSLGGYVAMDVAAARPGAVRGLVISGASLEPTGLAGWLAGLLAAVLDRTAGSRADALNAWFFRRRFAPWLAEPIVAGGFWPTGGAEALRAVRGQRFAPRLTAYPGPTLILNGEFDLVFRVGARSFARAADRSRRVRIAGAAHLSNLERPAAFDRAVAAFIRSLEPPRATGG